MAHDPKLIERLKESMKAFNDSLLSFFNEEGQEVDKDQPGSSSVHVPSTEWEKPKKGPEDNSVGSVAMSALELEKKAKEPVKEEPKKKDELPPPAHPMLNMDNDEYYRIEATIESVQNSLKNETRPEYIKAGKERIERLKAELSTIPLKKESDDVAHVDNEDIAKSALLLCEPEELRLINSLVEKAMSRRVSKVAVLMGDKMLMGKRRDNGKWTMPGGHANDGEDHLSAAVRELKEETGIDAAPSELIQLSHPESRGADLIVQSFKYEMPEKQATTMKDDPDAEVQKWNWIDKKDGLPEHIASNLHVSADRCQILQGLGIAGMVRKCVIDIFKADRDKQIVYGVVLEPHSIDAQADWLRPEEIEKAAHGYLAKSRVVGKSHTSPMKAEVVESYIAPVDFQQGGQYGNQTVKKGSWVLGVKVKDPKEWEKVLSGEYSAFSVGGFGTRSEISQ